MDKMLPFQFLKRGRPPVFSNQALEAVIKLAELGSFREAAEALGVSQATLTRHIQKAETDCGFPIFERTSRGAHLTGSGRELLDRCRDLRIATAAFAKGVDQIRTQGGGELMIGCGPLTARTIVQPVILSLLESWPDMPIHIDVRANVDPLKALAERKIDVFIGDLTHTPGFDDLTIRVLRKHEVIMVARPDHRIHRDGPCKLGDALRYPLALPYLHKHWQRVVQFALSGSENRAESSRRIPQIECDDYALLASIASHTEFLSGGTRENFAEHLQSGALREVSLTAPMFWNICAVRLTSSRFPSLEEFWHLLMEHHAE